MDEFLWIDWNRAKIANHSLGEEEVEFAWRHRKDFRTTQHPNGETTESFGQCPSGRWIKIVWRYNVDWDGENKVFVITAHNP